MIGKFTNEQDLQCWGESELIAEIINLNQRNEDIEKVSEEYLIQEYGILKREMEMRGLLK